MPQPSLTEVQTPQSRCLFALRWADITPPAGIYHRMWGAAKHERATGVHRALRATVAVFAPSPHPSPPLGAGEGVPAGRGRGRLRADSSQILLALDHCVLGAVEHEQLVTDVARDSGQAKEIGRASCRER